MRTPLLSREEELGLYVLADPLLSLLTSFFLFSIYRTVL